MAKKITEEQRIDVALEWAAGAIGLHEAADRLGVKTNKQNVLPILAGALREACRLGLLVIKR